MSTLIADRLLRRVPQLFPFLAVCSKAHNRRHEELIKRARLEAL